MSEEAKNTSEREEFLTNLMRMAAHDLNNVLSPILGYPELLMDSFPEGSQEQEDLLEIRKLANRAISLIKDVQMLLRPELKEPRPCDFNESLRKALTSSELTPEAKLRLDQIDIVLDLDDSLPPVNSAVHVLAALFKNLFAGSLFMVPDTGSISVKTSAADGFVQMEISQPVEKLEKDEMDRLLEPFFLRKRFGTNLTGLEYTVAQELMSQHKGRFSVDLEDGTLTTTITIPSV